MLPTCLTTLALTCSIRHIVMKKLLALLYISAGRETGCQEMSYLVSNFIIIIPNESVVNSPETGKQHLISCVLFLAVSYIFLSLNDTGRSVPYNLLLKVIPLNKLDFIHTRD